MRVATTSPFNLRKFTGCFVFNQVWLDIVNVVYFCTPNKVNVKGNWTILIDISIMYFSQFVAFGLCGQIHQQHCRQRHALLRKAMQNGMHKSKSAPVGSKMSNNSGNSSSFPTKGSCSSPDPEPSVSMLTAFSSS